MLVVSVDTEPSFTTGTPRKLFEGDFQTDVNGHPQYGVSPDGQRFLMLRRDPSSVFRVILDWADELERLAPAEP
jgi:hypothetical protein